jgi:hypothetical protein
MSHRDVRALPETQDNEYAVIPVIPVDDLVHTSENPFCGDLSCPCHGDPDAIGQLGEYYHEGLVSAEDADRIYRGQTLR